MKKAIHIIEACQNRHIKNSSSRGWKKKTIHATKLLGKLPMHDNILQSQFWKIKQTARQKKRRKKKKKAHLEGFDDRE